MKIGRIIKSHPMVSASLRRKVIKALEELEIGEEKDRKSSKKSPVLKRTAASA